jgi:hypothetical protein
MMSDLTIMPDTTTHWKAQIQRVAMAEDGITVKKAKEIGRTIEGCPVKNIAGFLQRRQWFTQTSKGLYQPKGIWHDTRYNPKITRKRRRDDIEYTIVSLLQNAGSMSSREIAQRIWLNNNRELYPTHITMCCTKSKHIVGSPDKWRIIS